MATSEVKSFRKAQKEDIKRIPGTRPSPQNFSLLTSCGLAALDTILGGGLPIGSLALVEEDQNGIYAEIIAKYFVAEGVLSNHRLFLGGLDNDVDQLVKTLPGSAEETPLNSNEASSSNNLKIAWRYKNMKVTDSSIDEKNSIGHKLILNTSISESKLAAADILRWPTPDHNYSDSEISGNSFLSKLTELLAEEKHQVGDGKAQRQVLRVALLGLGSPVWASSDVSSLLYNLRSWLRRSVAVGLVTVPSHLYERNEVWKWIHFSDICIRLESFAGTPRANNPALKDYHGIFQIVKLPAFNSLAPHIPPSDLAFKLKRRKLVIKRLSLPPELNDTSARDDGEPAFTGCGTSRAINLEF